MYFSNDFLKRGAGLGKELSFLGCRRTIKDGVSVRKTAETGDDVAVLFGIGQVVLKIGRVWGCLGFGFLDQTEEAFNPKFLGVKGFGMHKWHVEEDPFDEHELFFFAVFDGSFGQFKRQPIGLKCLRCAAKHVPGKLVENQDQREPPAGFRFPILILPRFSLFIVRRKPGPNLLINLTPPIEP